LNKIINVRLFVFLVGLFWSYTSGKANLNDLETLQVLRNGRIVLFLGKGSICFVYAEIDSPSGRCSIPCVVDAYVFAWTFRKSELSRKM